MFCSRCGAQLVSGSTFCGACGTPVSGAAIGRDVVRRPGTVTLIAVLQFVGAGFGILGAVGMNATTAGPGADQDLARAIALVLSVAAVAQTFCGVGLLKLRPYGRVLLLVFSWVGLLAFPLGTVVAILILFYMYKPGIKLLFSGKRVDEYTSGELQQMADVARGSTSSAVLIAVVVGVVVLALAGIVAAIAVPGLMRARASGNETAAIGSLWAINSAQAVFAINCSGGYAVALEDLASPLSAGSPALLSADLARSGVVKGGYSVTLVRGGGPGVTDVEPDSNTCSAVRHRPASDYFASAQPVTPGTTGSRYFATDARGVVYASEHPIANPIVESATVAPVR